MDEFMQTMMFEPGMHLFHALEPSHVFFETPEAGGEGGGALGADAGAVDTGAGADTAVVEPGAEVTPGDVEYMTPDELANLVRENAGTAFGEMLAEAERREQAAAQQRADAARAAEADQPPAWDPYDPASVDRYMEWRTAQMLKPILERIAPAVAFAEDGSREQGKTQANEILTSFHEELGEFDHEPAILRAAAYMRQGLEPEQALAQAATEQAEWEGKIGAAAVEKFKTTAQNIADAGLEPGATGAAAEATAPLTRGGQRISYKDSARASLARMGIGGGVGEPA